MSREFSICPSALPIERKVYGSLNAVEGKENSSQQSNSDQKIPTKDLSLIQMIRIGKAADAKEILKHKESTWFQTDEAYQALWSVLHGTKQTKEFLEIFQLKGFRLNPAHPLSTTIIVKLIDRYAAVDAPPPDSAFDPAGALRYVAHQKDRDVEEQVTFSPKMSPSVSRVCID